MFNLDEMGPLSIFCMGLGILVAIKLLFLLASFIVMMLLFSFALLIN